MLELLNNQLVFSFPDIHPDAKLGIEFQRTLRIPDDGGTYPLPPGLGAFPMAHVEDHEEKVPGIWRKHGGVMIPMYQSEALWIRFRPHTGLMRKHAYPFAVKVAAGKKSAITGKDWKKGLNKSDYCVTPQQKWLDGFVVDKGTIKQFIAVPLGAGLSVEEQLGDEEVGGLQIEVYPMKGGLYEAHFPKVEPVEVWEGSSRICRNFGGEVKISKTKGLQTQSLRSRRRRASRGATGQSLGITPESAVPGASDASYSEDSFSLCDSDDRSEGAATMDFAPDMAMGAGGDMKQDIEKDPYGKDAWVKKADGTSRSFVHLANSMMWRAITGHEPPLTPLTAADYRRHGLPWYDYESGEEPVKGGKKLKGIKSVKEMAKKTKQKGALPENESFDVPDGHVVKLPNEVSNGSW